MGAQSIEFTRWGRLARLAGALAFASLVAGCAPKIGDKCTISTDCSQLGDRLCDTTQPEGYCTIFNCEPDTCPDSVCVAFDPDLDPACGSADDSRWARFERTFCMKPCEDSSDCRDGYKCVVLKDEDLQDTPQTKTHRAQIVDIDPVARGVCLVGGAVPAPPSADAGVPAICEPADAGPPWTPYDAGGGTGGAGGMGTGGAGGMGGAPP